MNPLDALMSPRVHSQLLPDKVDVEDQQLPVLGGSPLASITTAHDVYASLVQRGHHNVTNYGGGMGVSQFITVDRDSGIRYAVSDPRKDGRPAAYS